MTDREDEMLDLYKTHAYLPHDAENNPLTPFGNFAKGYELAWQARGELDAVKIKELEARLNDTKNYHIEWCGANVKIADLTAKLEKETGRADAWVKAVRDLARELGTPDEDSNGSIQDWKRITAKAKQVKELEAKLREKNNG